MACVTVATCIALPTCGFALAESERYLPSLITKIDPLVASCAKERQTGETFGDFMNHRMQ